MTGTPCVMGVRVSSSCITIQKSNYQLCKQSVYHLTIWDLSSRQSRAALKCAFRAINCCCGIRDSVGASGTLHMPCQALSAKRFTSTLQLFSA